MKGKVGFVLGAALGYILGTRAGRARYEQIKRGATAVWETPVVQQGVTAVKQTVDNNLDNVKAAAGSAFKAAFDAATQGKPKQPKQSKPEGEPRGTSEETAL